MEITQEVEECREASSAASTEEGERSSQNGRQSNVELVVDEPTDKNPIGEEADEKQDDGFLSEGGSEDEFLLTMKKRQKTFEIINRNMERNSEKWKRLDEYVSLVNADDDSYSHLIDARIDEVKSMCVNLVRPDYILHSLNEPVKDYALSLIPMSRRLFEDDHREQWAAIDLFRYSGRMAHIFSLLGKTHLKYPWWEEAERRKNISVAKPSIEATKYSINKILRLSLTTHPTYRSRAAIQQVVWFNKAIGAFGDLFPTEMEKELAKYISYEIYDDGRVIRCQGDVPQKLYYILAGKMEMIKVYRLSQGEVHKSVGYLGHKQMSEFEGFDMGQESPIYLVARGRLEVLSLHKEDYNTLSSQTNIETIRAFLLEIGIFKDLQVSPDTLRSQLVRMQYYKHEKVITSDSLKAAYLYVVKSGRVAVARQQTVLDDSISSLLRSKDPFTLGCKRDGKHATAMLGLPKRQKNFKMMQLEKSHSMNVQRQEKRKIPYVKPHTMIGKFVVDDEAASTSETPTPETLSPKDMIVRSYTLFNMRTPRDIIEPEECKKVAEVLSISEKHLKEGRQTYVKLDSLKPLEIFGLDFLEETSMAEESRFVLISEGAEVLLVNKRYFLESVNNNTLLEIRKLVKSYLSEDEARVLIDEDMKWQAYKKILMQRMISLHC